MSDVHIDRLVLYEPPLKADPERVLDPNVLGRLQALLADTAAVGSYTTFSTWMLETQRLTEERQYRKAALNIAVSLVLGVAAAALGRLIGAHL